MPATSRHPVADHATFRDLNIFEERLKDTAASLQRRKSRYQFFLAQLLVIIALLLIEVFLPPRSSIISVPYKTFLVWLLPEVYTNDIDVTLHPYFTSGLLFVSVTTLVLFFASGMYTEKIAYANKYVPHTNRSLRAFNIYFNTRQPPLRSKFYVNPLSFFFPRPEETHLSRPPSPQAREPPSGRPRSSSTSRPIPSIPPATNPRGELIFSSRVDKFFREGYERYRTTFQKRRQEAIQYHKDQKWMERWRWLYKLRFWAPPPPSGPSPTLAAAAGFGRSASTSSSRGRGGGLSRSGTPPTPGSSGSTTTKQRDRSGSPMSRQRLPSRRSSNRRVTADGTERSNRRETGDERDMRMRALERSLAAQGLPSQ